MKFSVVNKRELAKLSRNNIATANNTLWEKDFREKDLLRAKTKTKLKLSYKLKFSEMFLREYLVE